MIRHDRRKLDGPRKRRRDSENQRTPKHLSHSLQGLREGRPMFRTDYFAVKFTEATTFSNSTFRVPLLPPAEARPIFNCSTVDGGLDIVIAVLPTIWASSTLPAPPRLMPHWPVCLLTIRFHLPSSKSANSVYSPLGTARPLISRSASVWRKV